MAISKVIYAGQTLIDLTNDTVEASKLLKGLKAHGADGELVTGTCTFDADTKDATVKEAEMLDGKTAYKNGVKITGTMPNRGGNNVVINAVQDVEMAPIARGFYDGSGYAIIDPVEEAKIIPANIREGVTILGVSGTMSGTEDAKAEAVEITPAAEAQTRLPDSSKGYNYISQVVVKAIPYNEAANNAGGTTVTIG